MLLEKSLIELIKKFELKHENGKLKKGNNVIFDFKKKFSNNIKNNNNISYK